LSEFEIIREKRVSKAAIPFFWGDGAKGELTCSIAAATMRIADHTGMSDAFRGTGAASALVKSQM
jgi:predicted GNAT family acetyltransferase